MRFTVDLYAVYAAIFVQNRVSWLPHLHSTPPLGGFRSEYRHPVWHGKIRMAWLSDIVKNFEDIFIRFDATYERDRHTDIQTPHDSIGRTYASHRAAKRLRSTFCIEARSTKHREASLRQQSFLLYRTLVRVNAHKCAKFQIPGSISYWDTDGSQNKNWEMLISSDAP